MLRIFVVLTLASLGFGCQPSMPKTPKNAIKINIGDDPQTLDPRKIRGLKCQTIARMLFEGLTRVNREEKAELAIAESFDRSDDLKTYTFHLKETNWSNGDPMSAEDFVYAWKKTLSPDFPSDTAFYLYPIKNAKLAKEGSVPLDAIGVWAKDEKTLVVELETPTPYFLELLAHPAFFPINPKVEAESPHWAQNGKDFVGNGPFLLVDWKPQDCIKLKKNAQYWDEPQVKIASLELPMLQEETELKLFEKKELDWAGSPLSTLPVDSLESLKKSHALQKKELLGTYLIRLNTERAPFDHPEMRKAFALAIDRRAIVDHVTQGDQIPATGLVPISLGLQKEPYFKDNDKETAQRIFKKALKDQKITPEQLSEITLIYRVGERNHLIAQAIQQQWFEAFDIRVKLEAIDGKIYFDRMSKQDFHLSIGSWIADFADPINFLEVFKYKKGGSNNTSWENPHYIQMLDQSMHATDNNERLDILARCEKLIINEMPIIPIFYYTMLYVAQNHLKDVVVSSMGQIDFKWASVVEEEK